MCAFFFSYCVHVLCLDTHCFLSVIEVHPKVHVYLKYAKWEEKLNHIAGSRRVYERATEELGADTFHFLSFSVGFISSHKLLQVKLLRMNSSLLHLPSSRSDAEKSSVLE